MSYTVLTEAPFNVGTRVSANESWETTVDLSPARIDVLARTMARRDRFVHEHAQRVQRYAVALAREAGINDEPMLEAIGVAALLHDIGKIGIPDRVLHKPGPLTQDEYDEVKLHPIIGAELLSAAALPESLVLLVRHHHENWDSTGYPDGLAGETIPIGARVLAIVDCYDALTSDRPYRRQLSHGRAVEMIEDRRGSMYDPDIVDAFLEIGHRMRPGFAREDAGRRQTPHGSPWLQARAV
jgi:putative nucleotidyltransferase with HDIG domain